MTIALRAASALAEGYGSVVVSKPAGVQVGDVMYAFVVNKSGATSPTLPGGWTSIQSGPRTVARRIVDGSEGGSFTFTTTASDVTDGAIIAWSGVDNTTPEDLALNFSGAAFHPATTVDAPSITTVTNNAVVMHIGMGAFTIAMSGLTASGDTVLVSGANRALGVSYKTQAVAGATGTTTLNMGAAGTWYAGSLALRPAPASDPVPGAPSAPSDLAETHDSTSVSLTWTNPGESDFAGTMVRRLAGATPPSSASDGTLVTSVAAPGASASATGLTAATQYSFSIFAYDGNGNYSAATSITVTTSPAAGAPDPVTNLLHSESAVAACLTWTNPASGSFTGAMVRRATGTTAPATPTAGTLVADLPSPGAKVVDSGLTSGTTYSYSVFAHDAYGNYAAAVSTTLTTTPAGATPSNGTRPVANRPSGVQRVTTLDAWAPTGRQPGSRQGEATSLLNSPNVLTRAYHYRQQTISGITSMTSKIRHKVLVNCSDVRFVFGNYSLDAGANDMTIRAGLEIGAGDFEPITFNGQRDILVLRGQTVVSDPVSIRFTQGQMIHSRTRVTVGSGESFPGSIIYSDSAIGEGRDTTGADLTTSGSVPVVGYVPLYGPCAAVGVPDANLRPVPCVALIGDSIMAEEWSAYVRRMENASIPFLLLAKATERVSYEFDPIRRRKRMRLVGSCTHAIVEYGVNDKGTYTEAQIKANLLACWKDLASRGIKVYQTTITPHSSSTDGWTTLANQTPSATESSRVGLNDWIRAGAPIDGTTLAVAAIGDLGSIQAGHPNHPLTGFFEVADQVESARNSGKWSLASGTTDGLHPGRSGDNLIMNAIDITKFVP